MNQKLTKDISCQCKCRFDGKNVIQISGGIMINVYVSVRNMYVEKIIFEVLHVVAIHESKKIIKKYEELWTKIRDLIRSVTKNSNDYDEIYMKINFNSDDESILSKTIEIPSIRIVVRAVFHENKNYLQFYHLMNTIKNYTTIHLQLN